MSEGRARQSSVAGESHGSLRDRQAAERGAPRIAGLPKEQGVPSCDLAFLLWEGAERMTQRGFTFIEVLVSMVLILVATSGGYVALVQSLRYMGVSRDVRHAIIDAQGILEEVQASSPAQLFDDFALFPEEGVPLDEGMLAARGIEPLADETITVTYLPGRVENVLRSGAPNDVQFTYAGSSPGSYQVSDATLRVTYGDGSISEVDGTGSGEVDADEGQTITFAAFGTLASATKVELLVTLEGVDGAGEVDLFVNGRGPYAPGPQFFGGGEVSGSIFLPDLQPLRARVENAWMTHGHELKRTLTGARIW